MCKNMNNIPFIKKMNPKSVSILFLIILIVIGLLVGVIISAGGIYRANQRVKEIDSEAKVKPGFPFLSKPLSIFKIIINSEPDQTFLLH